MINKVILGYPSKFWDRYKDETLPEPVNREIDDIFEKNILHFDIPEDAKIGRISDFKHEQT